MKQTAMKQIANMVRKELEGMEQTGWVDGIGKKMMSVFLQGLEEIPESGVEEIDFDNKKFYSTLMRWLTRAAECFRGVDRDLNILLPATIDKETINLLRKSLDVIVVKGVNSQMVGFRNKEDYRHALQIIWFERAKSNGWRRLEDALVREGVCANTEFDLARSIYPFGK